MVSTYPKGWVALFINSILSHTHRDHRSHELQTCVFSAQWYHCTNPTVYPQPELFKPERWLVDDADALHAMNRHLVVFSNGSRNCIGQK